MNSTENNQKNIIGPEDNSKSKKNRNFYIALTLCVAAVSAAGWSTYQSVKNFLSPVGVNSKAKRDDSQKSAKHKNILESGKSDIFGKDESPINSGSKRKGNASSIGTAEGAKAVSAEAGGNLIIYPSTKNVIKEFSGDNPVYSKTFSDWRTHQGTDLRAEEGSMIKSITDGKVKDITNDSVYGTTVIVEHSPGFTAYYCGLGENALVKPGQEIRTGDDIGSLKNIPCEILDEPHLHLMISKDDKFIDPILILDGTPS